MDRVGNGAIFCPEIILLKSKKLSFALSFLLQSNLET
jgi:hypothetical protein